MTIFFLIIGMVAFQRILELMLARRNTKRLMAEGGVEIGAGHYPLFILLHASWLLAIVLFTEKPVEINFWLLGLFILLQAGRLWVIASLGKYWTTRIITLPGEPLVRSGPYRYFRHPNYLIVIGEIALLPLVFGNWPVAVIWSLANGLLLMWRIRVENTALGERAFLQATYE